VPERGGGAGEVSRSGYDGKEGGGNGGDGQDARLVYIVGWLVLNPHELRFSGLAWSGLV
jgi:hypothetical protein